MCLNEQVTQLHIRNGVYNAAPMSSHRIIARAPAVGTTETKIRTDINSLAAVKEDAAHFPGGHATGVAQPTTEGEVAELVRRTHRLLPIGAQSSLTGGATPMGEIVVDMQRFDRILSISSEEVVVQPGVPIGVLQAILARAGKYYPPVPTFDGASVGGTVATNAAGATTFKYGTTRDWVNGLTVVLSNGEVLDIVRGQTTAHPDGYFEIVTSANVRRVPVPTYSMVNVAKCSAGYFVEPEMDLIDLFIGSEGTLGIITEITLAVVAPAPQVALVWISLTNEQAAFELTCILRKAAQNAWRNADASALDVSAIEYLDARSLAIVREDGAVRMHEIGLPDDATVALIARVEFPSDISLKPENAYKDIGQALSDGAADTPLTRLCRLLASSKLLERSEIVLPADSRRQAQITAIREAVPEGVNKRVADAKRCEHGHIEKTAADMIVPYDRFNESLRVFRRAFDSRDLDYAIWGHISDGNLHPNVIPRNLDDVRRGREAILECGREIVKLGGCPLAEHGVGRNLVKQALLHEFYGERGIAQMRTVKVALDPKRQLAPGVLFPDSP